MSRALTRASSLNVSIKCERLHTFAVMLLALERLKKDNFAKMWRREKLCLCLLDSHCSGEGFVRSVKRILPLLTCFNELSGVEMVHRGGMKSRLGSEIRSLTEQPFLSVP